IHILHRLVEMGNTVVTIEHNLDIVKDADYLIDLGPEGGEQGGYIVACGSPLEVANDGKQSHTARFLREYLNGGAAKPSKGPAPARQEEGTSHTEKAVVATRRRASAPLSALLSGSLISASFFNEQLLFPLRLEV